jgi:hypothetical protein
VLTVRREGSVCCARSRAGHTRHHTRGAGPRTQEVPVVTQTGACSVMSEAYLDGHVVFMSITVAV